MCHKLKYEGFSICTRNNYKIRLAYFNMKLILQPTTDLYANLANSINYMLYLTETESTWWIVVAGAQKKTLAHRNFILPPHGYTHKRTNSVPPSLFQCQSATENSFSPPLPP